MEETVINNYSFYDKISIYSIIFSPKTNPLSKNVIGVNLLKLNILNSYFFHRDNYYTFFLNVTKENDKFYI